MKLAATPAFALLSLSLKAAHVAAAGETFYYDVQSDWPTVNAPADTNNECGRENASGEGQSPIDITTTECPVDIGAETKAATDASRYMFYAGDCSMGDYKFTINDHGLKAEIVGSCMKPHMVVPGTEKEYEVLQFHIHTGCEHNFDGKGCDAELHIVHVAKDGATIGETGLPDLAVVGLMLFGDDKYNDAIDPLLDGWSAVSCNDDCDAGIMTQYENVTFNPYSLLPSGTNFYNYQGSLTTPPCWEVVTWNVAEAPTMVSWRQILKISNLVNNFAGARDDAGVCQAGKTVASEAGLTGRDTQPILGRQIQKICTPYKYGRSN